NTGVTGQTRTERHGHLLDPPLNQRARHAIYWSRSETVGSTLAARPAGIAQAASVAMANTTIVTAYVPKSVGAVWNSMPARALLIANAPATPNKRPKAS